MGSDRPSRPELHERFVQLFAPAAAGGGGDIVLPVSAAELDEIEKRLEVVLPAAYREFLQRYGPLETPKLAQRLEESPWHARVFGFERLGSGRLVLALNSGPWISTVPAHVTGFAEDRGEDVFHYLVAFTTDSLLDERICFARCGVPNDDLPILHFDHDADQIVQVAPSFDDLLWWYIRHLGPDADWDRMKLRVGPIPPFEEMEFTADNDHNPSYVEQCARCNGFGKLFTFKYDRPRRAEDDLPCPDCRATGWVQKHLSDNENPAVEVALGPDGWITCPCCHLRFPPKRSGGWTGYRHMRCGQRIILRGG